MDGILDNNKYSELNILSYRQNVTKMLKTQSLVDIKSSGIVLSPVD